MHRALLQREGIVRNHQTEIVVDHVSEALAAGARAERVIEAEQARFGVHELDPGVAVLAGELLAEPDAVGRLLLRSACARFLEHRLAAFPVGDLHAIHHARPLGRIQLQAVHQHEEVFAEVDAEERFGRRELEDLPLLKQPREAAFREVRTEIAQFLEPACRPPSPERGDMRLPAGCRSTGHHQIHGILCAMPQFGQ